VIVCDARFPGKAQTFARFVLVALGTSWCHTNWKDCFHERLEALIRSFGKKVSDETTLKMSAAMKGERNPNFGKKGERHPTFGKKCNACKAEDECGSERGA